MQQAHMFDWWVLKVNWMPTGLQQLTEEDQTKTSTETMYGSSSFRQSRGSIAETE